MMPIILSLIRKFGTPILFLFATFWVPQACADEKIEYTKITALVNGLLKEFVYPLKVLLPKDVVKAINPDGQLPIANQLVLDTRGSFYRFTQTKGNISTIIDGLLDRSRTPQQCAAIARREVIYGTNEPRGQSDAFDLESDPPWREFTFAFGCSRYAIRIQCQRGAPTPTCNQALQGLQKLRDWRHMLSLAKIIRDDNYRGSSAQPSSQGVITQGGSAPRKSRRSLIWNQVSSIFGSTLSRTTARKRQRHRNFSLMVAPNIRD